MQLFTINATPVRVDVSEQENQGRVADYPSVVSDILLKKGYLGFTIREVLGFWQGVSEVSFEISVATDNGDGLLEVARELRQKYDQDSVMVTTPDREVSFVED